MEYAKLAGTKLIITTDASWQPLDSKGRLYQITVQQGTLALRASSDSADHDSLVYYTGQSVHFMGRAEIRSDDGSTLICYCLELDPV